MSSTALTKEADAEKYYAKENSAKEQLLFKHILKYYQEKPEWLATVRLICEQEHELSLRRLDAIISKNTLGNLCYYLTSPIKEPLKDEYEAFLFEKCGIKEHLIPFNMVSSYLQQLRHHQKRYFDSFRRRTKVTLGTFETSFSQLNFFIWIDKFQLLPVISSINYDEKKAPIKNKNKKVTQHLVLYHHPVYVPVIPLPVRPKKLLLTPKKEYALLQNSIMYYRTHAMKDLIVRRPYPKLNSKLPHTHTTT